ncbi:MAG: hypothetical protein ABRQ25_00575 [Clostridiaceae bacterium]
MMYYKKIKFFVLFFVILLTFLNLCNLRCRGYENLQKKFLERHEDIELTLIIEGKSIENYKNFGKYMIENIPENFEGSYKSEQRENSDEIKGVGNNFNMGVEIYNESPVSFRIVYSTKNKKENLEAVKKYINYLLKEKAYELRYFQEIKGRIEIEDNLRETLINELKSLGIEKYSLLKLSNGFTGKAESGNNTINFAICTYEKKSYIIIGEPIIISTY